MVLILLFISFLFKETISELKNALNKTFDYHYFVTRPTVSLAKQEDIRNCQFKGSLFIEFLLIFSSSLLSIFISQKKRAG
jgi:hypothetical protein